MAGIGPVHNVAENIGAWVVRLRSYMLLLWKIYMFLPRRLEVMFKCICCEG